MLGRFDITVKYLTLVLTPDDAASLSLRSATLDLAFEHLECLAHLADGIFDTGGARPARLVGHEHAQPEVGDGLSHGAGVQASTGVEPPRAPVAHADDREGGDASIRTATELAAVDAALNDPHEVVEHRAPRVLRGRAMRFGQAAFAALDDAKLHRVRQD